MRSSQSRASSTRPNAPSRPPSADRRAASSAPRQPSLVRTGRISSGRATSATTARVIGDRVPGPAIPLGARIIAACDAYVKMVTEQPYEARGWCRPKRSPSCGAVPGASSTPRWSRSSSPSWGATRLARLLQPPRSPGYASGVFRVLHRCRAQVGEVLELDSSRPAAGLRPRRAAERRAPLPVARRLVHLDAANDSSPRAFRLLRFSRQACRRARSAFIHEVRRRRQHPGERDDGLLGGGARRSAARRGRRPAGGGSSSRTSPTCARRRSTT